MSDQKSAEPFRAIRKFRQDNKKTNYSYKNVDIRKRARPRKNIEANTKKVLESLDLESLYHNDKVFAYALLFRLKDLEHILKNTQTNVNHTIYEDNIIMFLVKHVYIEDDKIIPLLELLLNAGIDINKLDIEGNHILDHLIELYQVKIDSNNSGESNFAIVLKRIVKMMINTGVSCALKERTINLIEGQMGISINCLIAETNISMMFRLVVTNTLQKADRELLKIHANDSNGEHTFLQLACMLSDQHLKSVKILLEHKADPNLVTTVMPEKPLEIAARKKHELIFDCLLTHPETEITNDQYDYFIKIRGCPMTLKSFDQLLCSDKLSTKFKNDKGNTPLHYAIIFDVKDAIYNLLKRGASLYSRNDSGKCPLDMIDPGVLENHLTANVKKDTYARSIAEKTYKTYLDFSSLINEEDGDEYEGLYTISSNPKLEHLLQHPLVYLFISLKWCKAEKYYYTILALQAIIFMLMSAFFYFAAMGFVNVLVTSLGYFLVLLNACKLLLIFYCFNFRKFAKNHKECRQKTSCSSSVWSLINFFSSQIHVLQSAMFHSLMELSVIVTSLGILLSNETYKKQFSSFIFVEMASCFLLTAGYHPLLSVWSIMLQKVLKSFIMLSIFFSLIILGFAAGFHILFLDDDNQPLFHFFGSSIVKTYIMTAGEFDANSVQFEKSGHAGYALFFLFAMCFCLVVVNFWTGIAVTDIEKIRKDAELSALKNVVVFEGFVSLLSSQQIFPRKRDSKGKVYDNVSTSKNNSNKFGVDFFINQPQKFGPNEGLRVRAMAVEKIRELCKATPKDQDIAEQFREFLQKHQHCKICNCIQK